MKRINLKKYYYPFYEADTFIELPDEVADAIEEEHRIEHNSERRLQGHTYSFDCSPGLEYHFLEQAPSAEDAFLAEELRREKEEQNDLMSRRLQEALATLTPKQACCIKARFVDGLKFHEIAEAEGISTTLATSTTYQAITKLRKYFIKHGWMEPTQEVTICTKPSPPKRNRKRPNRNRS